MTIPTCVNCGQRHEGEWCPKRIKLAEAIRAEDSKPSHEQSSGTLVGSDSLQAALEDRDSRLSSALDALHLMVEQYCGTEKNTEAGTPVYYHMHMTAGETALQVLEDEGRISGDQW